MPQEHPPKPRFSLSVGIIGHRPNRLPSEALAKIAAQMELALRTIGDAAGAARQQYADCFSPESVQVTVVSSLAEGADRIGAREALKLGFELAAPLPFRIEEFKNDFQDLESRQEFDQLLGKAATVLEIASDRSNAGAAYEYAGQTLLDACDLLVTIWDGKDSAGRGGTTALLYEAAQKGMPVIWIEAAAQARMRVYWREPGSRRTEQTYFDEEFRAESGDDILSAIAVIVEHLVCPPRAPAERGALDYFLRQPFRPLTVNAPFPLLMALLGVRKLRSSDFRRTSPEIVAANLSRQEIAPASLVDAFVWADECAIFFGQAFRGAFILNFLATAMVTVVVALALQPPWSALEICLVALLVYNTSRGRKGRWHKLWIEAREVAERLRASMLIYAIGSRPELPLGDAPAWTTWYVRAHLRQVGLRPAVLDHAGLTAIRQSLLSFLEGQQAYHYITAKRFTALHERLSTIGKWLFFFTLGISVTLLIVGLFELSTLSNETQRLFFVLTAGLTALGAAMYGVRVIGDFEGAAARSRRMVAQLKGLAAKLEHAPCRFDTLREMSHRAADVLQGDVASWRLVVESRELEVPG